MGGLIYYFCRKPTVHEPEVEYIAADQNSRLLASNSNRSSQATPKRLSSVDVDKSSLGSAPHPHPRTRGDWSEYHDDKGDPYYHNNATGVTTWDAPPEFKYPVEYEYTPDEEEYIRNNTGRYLVRALYDFVPERTDLWQLTFAEGDLLWVVDSHHEEQWWIGEKRGTQEQGYFPRSHVQVLKRKFKVGAAQGENIQTLSNTLQKRGL